MIKLNGLFFFLVVFVFLSDCTSSPAPVDSIGVGQDSGKQSPSQKVDYLSNCKHLYGEALHMDSVLLSQNEVVYESANKAIKAFTDFAYYCASDSLSPIYLIKTAQIARVIDNIPQAKIALEKCMDGYPNFNNRAAAIFLLAQLYDEATYLNDEHEARKLYQKIIEEYPKSEWAMNAKAAVKLLGKTDEEIIKEFTKKNGK
jgi:outer membrane protein assembly factor BamD (BamD/ComL family)